MRILLGVVVGRGRVRSLYLNNGLDNLLIVVRNLVKDHVEYLMFQKQTFIRKSTACSEFELSHGLCTIGGSSSSI